MKRIPLTQGKFAIVDDEDFESLIQWKWSYLKTPWPRLGYAIRRVPRRGDNKAKLIRMQHLILDRPSGFEVDHINHNGLDNRRANLRLCTHAQNLFNKRCYKGNQRTSLFKGVSKKPSDRRWRARLHFNGKMLELGYFDEERDAAAAYNVAAKEHFGEFAHLNVV